MKRIILTLIVLALIPMQANAQLGLSINYQLSHHKSEITGNNAVMNGMSGGLFYDFWILPGFAFEPGVTYSYGTNIKTGYNSAGTAVIRNPDEAISEHYLNLPLMARLQVPVGMMTRMSFYFGPTIALAVSVPEGYSRSNIMLGGGIGVDFGPLTLKANYDLGSGYRGALCLGLAFSFGQDYGPRGHRGGYGPGPGGYRPR